MIAIRSRHSRLAANASLGRVWAGVLLVSLLVQSSSHAGPRSLADLWQNATRSSSPVEAAVPHPSVARITALEKNAHALGSGTLIDTRDKYGLVITNWHVIRDATGDIVVTFPNGFQSKAQVLQFDKDWDLAALVIWRPNLVPVSLTTVPPRPGDPLTIAGYGSGNYRAIGGRCTQYVAPNRLLPHEMVEVSVEARQGDSGGPIFNERGELAGVLFGAGGGTTAGSWAGRVRAFLGPLSATLGQSSAAPNDPQIAQGQGGLDAIPSGNDRANGNTVTPPTTNNRAPVSQDDTSRSATALTSLPHGVPKFSESLVPNQSLIPVPPMSAADDPILRPLPSPSGATVSGVWDDQHPRPVTNDTSPGDLRDLVGKTFLEQAKTALALVGILAFLFQLARFSRAE